MVFYEKPLLAFERMVSGFQHAGLSGLRTWLGAAPGWIREKLHVQEVIAESLAIPGERVRYLSHHLSHASAAFYPSPFESAAILTVDGVGEWASASIGRGRDRDVELLAELRYPDSLGLLYSAFTQFCGFKVNSGEYKLMGLAPYGEPSYLPAILENIVSIGDDGSLRLNMKYFDYVSGRRMTARRMARLFGGPPRQPETRITRREIDLAASVQVVVERAMAKMAAHAKAITGESRLCLAGGVALNCVANGHLLRSGMFNDIWIQPASGDAGSAIGAALSDQHGRMGIARPPAMGADRQRGSFLGPRFSEEEIAAYLEADEIPHLALNAADRADTVARALAEGNIVGLFNGRMEFGPRALGARSILGDPRRADMQSIMNLRVKYRESFRPFAPAVLAEDAGQFFDLDRASPYMLFVAPLRENFRSPREGTFPAGDDLLAAVNQSRSSIPAVIHWDYSARIQTVHRATNPFFHDVLTAFKRRTGVGVLVNTSFNVRGEPIVCTPQDAYRCFIRTGIDRLYLDGHWLEKEAQKAAPHELSAH